jgi:ATP-dependent RNA helicase DeaD
MSQQTDLTFAQLSLAPELLRALDEAGYERPSPIQAECVPALLAGRDVLGQAQTGTGKTAAFALPLLQQLDLVDKRTQALILAPTRELAGQVCESLKNYGRYLPGLRVLPVYGGAGFREQLQGLKQGAQVVVGTPGRILDHLQRGTLVLSDLKMLVLDEADEMLRMGFIEDVETILAETPAERRVALFSATMPREIRRVADSYLKDPVTVQIAAKTATAEGIAQSYYFVPANRKHEALARIVEAEDFDAMIIFARTKQASGELADKLIAAGYAASALNGDMNQQLRERTVERLRNGSLDIVVATDVAARGLDVARISHVLNFDLPTDLEAYVHRIGRTGRAGRQGKAIALVSHKDKRLLRAIERHTRMPMTEAELPTQAQLAERREVAFKARVAEVLGNGELDFYTRLVTSIQREHQLPAKDVAAALALMLDPEKRLQPQAEEPVQAQRRERGERRNERFDKGGKREARPARERRAGDNDLNLVRYRIAVGRDHGVQPKHIVGAIANEAGVESRYIGHIKLHDDHSLVDLPEGMPKEIFHHLKKVRVCGKPLAIQRMAS